MKISLGKPELLAILSDHFGRMVEDITIVKEGGKSLAEKITRELAQKVGINDIGSISTQEVSKKIPAIKLLREIVPGLGLADSKWAIENWREWIAFVAKHNRVPNISNAHYGTTATLS